MNKNKSLMERGSHFSKMRKNVKKCLQKKVSKMNKAHETEQENNKANVEVGEGKTT